MNTNTVPFIRARGFAPLYGIRNELERLFEDSWNPVHAGPNQATQSDWSPACDIEEDQTHYLLTLDVPGVQKDQIKLEILDGQMTISGERHEDRKSMADGVWYSERRQGKFVRHFKFPVVVDTDKIEASYQEGILRVSVPKVAAARPRQIKINAGLGPGITEGEKVAS